MGVETGGCCFTVTGTGPTKEITGKIDKQVADKINEVWPIYSGTRYLCSTNEQLSKVQGWKAGPDGKSSSVDGSMKFANKGKSKAVFQGAVATWTCSGAMAALSISGAAFSGVIMMV